MDADRLVARVAKPIVFLLCLAPAGWVVVAVGSAQAGGAGWALEWLGANPVEKVQDTLGIWGLRFLLLTLVITPARVLFGWTRLHAFRRMLGLFAFFYVGLHFLWYLLVDQSFDWRQLLGDVAKRPYITAGFAALVLLVPLASTSTRRAMRRLGRRWQTLHRLVYPATVLACIHFWWQVKADIREPLVYATVAALLLGWRAWRSAGRRRARAGSGSARRARGAGTERDAGEDQQAAAGGTRVHRLAEQPPSQQ